MTAKQVAALTGISVRTLHHYDTIGLLCPHRNPENDYRQYTDENLNTLQQILFFKECGFPLAEIQKMLSNPLFNKQQAFALQKKYLLHQKKRINAMLSTLNKTIQATKGEVTMSQKEKFAGFNLTHNPYEQEARQLWGDDVINASNQRIQALSTEEQNTISLGMDALFAQLATLRKTPPASAEAQAAMHNMFAYFNNNFGHTYTLEAFAGLGQMYVADTRFTENIDKYGSGLCAFLAQAMQIYANNNR